MGRYSDDASTSKPRAESRTSNAVSPSRVGGDEAATAQVRDVGGRVGCDARRQFLGEGFPFGIVVWAADGTLRGDFPAQLECMPK